MSYDIVKVYQGKMLHEEQDLTLVELCEICDLQPPLIIELVDEGFIEPFGESKVTWRFSFEVVEKVKKVNRLQRDLELNIAGAILVSQLLHRIEKLESKFGI